MIDEDIFEFVFICNGFIINVCDISDLVRLGIVGENEELLGRNGVINIVESWFLYVIDDYLGFLDVDGNNSCGEFLLDISCCLLE